MTFLKFIALGALLVLFVLRLSKRKPVPNGYRLVPGPKGVPFFGNVFQIPPQNPQIQFKKWAAEYGELFKIQMGYFDWVFINTPEAAKDIFDKQSAVTSSRPPMPFGELVSGYMRVLLMSYGEEWRKLRSIVHQLLSPKMSNTFQPSQEFEAKQLLNDILRDRQDESAFYNHNRRYSLSVIMTSTYGRRVPSWDCEEQRQVYELMEDFSNSAAPGAHLVDVYPPLQNLPMWMQWWRGEALSCQQRQAKAWLTHWNKLKGLIETGDAPECFCKQFIETGYEKKGISELQAAFVAGTMIEAGSETTSSTLNSACLLLAMHPHVMARAWEELDRVVGTGRQPTFRDEEQLIYIRSIAKEVLRLRPVANVGSPHRTTADILYKDYFIPSGTVVTLFQYTTNFDPTIWDEPQAFRPERYLEYPLKAGAYAGMADGRARDNWSFGAGRRICPGVHLAENSLFITLAKLLWAFDIKPPVGADGKQVELDTSDDAYEAGANTLPKPFKLRFIPRGPNFEKIVKDEWRTAESEAVHL